MVLNKTQDEPISASVWMDLKLHKVEIRLEHKRKLRCGSLECLAKSLEGIIDRQQTAVEAL